MRERRRGVEAGFGRSILAGAVSGALASWVMERAQAPLSRLGGARVQERERAAQAGVEPPAYRAAAAAAAVVGRTIPEERRALAAGLVHYATGASWGAVLGGVAHALRARGLGTGLLFGAAVWLVSDELLVPALGFSRPAPAYPPSAHGKALAAHLVYGAATEAGVRALT